MTQDLMRQVVVLGLSLQGEQSHDYDSISIHLIVGVSMTNMFGHSQYLSFAQQPYNVIKSLTVI